MAERSEDTQSKENNEKLFRQREYQTGYRRSRGEAVAERGRLAVFANDLLRFLRYGLKFALYAALLFSVLYFVFNTDAFPALKTRTATIASNLKLDTFYHRIADPISRSSREYVTGIGTFKPPEQTQQAIVQLVKHVQFKSVSSQVYEKSAIEMLGSAEIEPLWVGAAVDEARVAFDCLLEDPETKKTLPGTLALVGQDVNSVVVTKSAPQFVSFLCRFDATSFADLPDTIDYRVYKTHLKWKYEGFETTTILRALTLSKNAYVGQQQLSQDVLQGYRDRYLDSYGRAQSWCVSGCGLANAFLTIQAPMPLVDVGPSVSSQPGEAVPYYLELGLTGLEYGNRKGEVLSLDSLTLQLPDTLVFARPCAFFGSDLTFDATDSSFEQVNNDISRDDINDLKATCTLKPVNVKDLISPGFVTLRAVYDYGETVTTTITVQKQPPGVVLA